MTEDQKRLGDKLLRYVADMTSLDEGSHAHAEVGWCSLYHMLSFILHALPERYDRKEMYVQECWDLADVPQDAKQFSLYVRHPIAEEVYELFSSFYMGMGGAMVSKEEQHQFLCEVALEGLPCRVTFRIDKGGVSQ